jgi:signal peptidase complex subunit 1
MDFEGQKLAEIIFHILIISFGAIGWVIGYLRQDFTVVFYWWLVGLGLSVLVCIAT